MAKKKQSKKTKIEIVEPASNPGGIVVGVDPSWTGLALHAHVPPEEPGLFDEGLVPESFEVGKVLHTKPGQFPNEQARLEHLGDDFRAWIEEINPKVVFIEGYAMGSKTRPQQAGELGGHLKLALWQLKISFAVVPPTTLKQYVLGTGVGKKELMIMKAYQRWGFEAKDNNECDAYCLRRMAREYLDGEWTKKFHKIMQGCEVIGG